MSDKLKITSVSNIQAKNTDQNFFGSSVGYPHLVPTKTERTAYPLNAEQPVLTHWDVVVEKKDMSFEDYRDYAQNAGM